MIGDRTLQRHARLHEGFLRSATRWPDRTALRIGAESWTYSDVGQLAGNIAEGLRAAAHAPRRVGICARRSIGSYAGTLGALLAGAAFVPLNPTLPAARLRSIVDIADLDAILCDGQTAGSMRDLLADHPAPPPIVETDGGSVDVVRSGKGRATDERAGDIAYILFTSGSTGTPKGVPISHGNVTSFLKTNLDRYGVTENDVLSQTFEQSFDLSIFDIFMAWSAGATLCGFTPAELLAPLGVARARQLTVWFSVPSMVAMQMKLGLLTPDSLPSLRLSLFCGEPLPQEYAEAWQRAAPGSVIENLYGPTELTIACAAHRWEPRTSPALCANGIVPIGRPYDGLSFEIVDEDLVPAGRGQVGELAVAGPQTFSGYWRNPEADAAAFYEKEASTGERRRYYRTGDLVRELPGGDITFVGRRDHQVKINGHRIELGEVEAALRDQDGVVEAVAFAWPPSPAVAERIVAAVSGNGIDGDALRTRLRSTLPGYMLPALVEVIEAMPRTSSGKLDRRAVKDLLVRCVGAKGAAHAV
ncbi:amino acid adenylation domain-containing protein [Arenibaculum sp.]|uniref:amino acid adenylation domain-containing protein n=1 Tax=Arenibaculum sp. TaxID=2865862 RepID=UPI002E0E1788|nr:amino acid adenylation domain-containing protein [Arenibaculum sp.]